MNREEEQAKAYDFLHERYSTNELTNVSNY